MLEYGLRFLAGGIAVSAFAACYTEGFSHFVTSMTAPVASGWSVHRVGLSPTGKRRLLRRTQRAVIPQCREPPFNSIARDPGQGDPID
jgi:hypothetical protein